MVTIRSNLPLLADNGLKVAKAGPVDLEDLSSKSTTEQKACIGKLTDKPLKGVLDKLNDASLVGMRAGCTSFIAAALASDFFGIGQNPSFPISCSAFGVPVALGNLLYKRTENLTDQSESIIQTAVKSVYKGFADGSCVLISGLSLGFVFSNCQSLNSNICQMQIREFTNLSLVGVLTNFVLGSRLNRNKQDSTPVQPVSNLGRLKNACKIVGDAAITTAVPLCLAIPVVGQIRFSGTKLDLKPTFFALSAITGLAGAVENFYSIRKGVNSDLRIRKMFFEALPGASKVYSAAFLVGVFTVEFFGLRINDLFSTVFVSSALLGAAQAARSVFQKSRDHGENGVLSKIYQNWKSTSKVTKIAVALTSLAALSVVYLGGPDEAYEFGANQYEQASRSVSKMALKTFNTLAYNEKSIQSTYSEFLNGLPDKEMEMKRLAGLAIQVRCDDDDDIECQEQKLEDYSCAQILQTCHLDAKAIRDHLRVYRAKMFRFHPDQNPQEKKLSELASQTLSYAYELMKNNKKCSGQVGEGCNQPLKQLTRTLLKPNMLFNKLFNLNPTCIYTMDGESYVMSLEGCEGL